jgi:hypothetical protein
MVPVVLELTGFRDVLDHIRDGEAVVISLGGTLEMTVAGVKIPTEYFSSDNAGIAAIYPHSFEVRAGTPQVLGYPTGNAGASSRAMCRRTARRWRAW